MLAGVYWIVHPASTVPALLWEVDAGRGGCVAVEAVRFGGGGGCESNQRGLEMDEPTDSSRIEAVSE